MRRPVSRAVGVLALAGLTAGVAAGPAGAKTHYTPAQKAKVRAELRHALKKNPKLIGKASFIKKASLVDFTLPVTIRVRQATAPGPNAPHTDNTGTTNTAKLDLGPSLGTRVIGLGGALPAEIKFHDSFDGGGLGNVDLSLLPGGPGLTTTSVPLLANTDVTDVAFSANPAAPSAGCGGFTSSTNDVRGIPAGVDGLDNITGANNNPGNDNVGTGSISIGGPYDPADTVLRTGSLTLKIAQPGVDPNGPNGQTIGKSGGQANLFGNLPGKSTAIDVTASLATRINTILREVDGGSPPPPNNAASVFNCRQAWTGYTDNTLGGIHLQGDLHISPAITADGKLRIAKASLSSPANEVSRVALTACLVPDVSYAKTAGAPALIDPTQTNPAPTSDPCNTVGPVLAGALGVSPLSAPGPDSSVTNDGSAVTVAGDVSVQNLSAEVLIGGNQGA